MPTKEGKKHEQKTFTTMTDRNGNSSAPPSHDQDRSCPDRGSERIATEIVDHHFPYGREDSAVELSACIPVRRCEECGEEFLDDEAEDQMHEAVCRHHLAETKQNAKSQKES